jgi:hypothetical protein
MNILQTEESTITFKFFHIRTEKPDVFVDKLEQLCRECCVQEDFFFKYTIED